MLCSANSQGDGLCCSCHFTPFYARGMSSPSTKHGVGVDSRSDPDKWSENELFTEWNVFIRYTR